METAASRLEPEYLDSAGSGIRSRERQSTVKPKGDGLSEGIGWRYYATGVSR
jgi:hypothetical protein